MKVYLSDLNESWVVDRFRKDWYINNKDISTNRLWSSDLIWIISPWIWNKIPKRYLKNKKTLCSIYHIDFENFDKSERKDFYNRDQYINEYHVISKKTEEQLKTLTNKKITSIPFWVDNKIFFNINDKSEIRKKYGFKNDDYIVGSFQRDTEGHDLKSPKLIKGPDILFKLICQLNNQNKNLKVLLAGKRRQYIINKLNQEGIPFQYFEMADIKQINELYNVLDLYLVTSRLEGGPQAILEASISKTPILSTDVGVAREILHETSIFSVENFSNSKPNIDYAFQRALKFTIPNGMKNYRKLLFDLYEN